MNNSEKLWINDISVLVDEDKMFNILPKSNLFYEQNLNNLVRLGFYISFIVSIVTTKIKNINIFFYSLIFSYLFYIILRLEKFQNPPLDVNIDSNNTGTGLGITTGANTLVDNTK